MLRKQARRRSAPLLLKSNLALRFADELDDLLADEEEELQDCTRLPELRWMKEEDKAEIKWRRQVELNVRIWLGRMS